MYNLLCLSSLLLFLFQSAYCQNKKELKLPKGYVYIEAGEVDLDGLTYNVGDFYMLDHEVSNDEYASFMRDQMLHEKELELFDSLQEQGFIAWEQNASKEIPEGSYVNEYKKYPVLGLPKINVEIYCIWLSRVLTEKYGKGKYTIQVRLPKRVEWVYAARAGRADAIYSSGTSLHTPKGKALCNYWEAETKDPNHPIGPADITIPVHKMKKNPWKLYNMSGNAAEMVQEDLAVGGSWYSSAEEVKIEAVMEYDGKGSPYVGFRPILIVREK